MPPKLIKIYADGSCIGNPGPGGYAGVLMCGDNLKTITGNDPTTTNNRMELMAAISCLEAIKVKDFVIEIYVDSRYVYEGMTSYISNWQSNGRKTSTKQPVKNIDLWQRLVEVSTGLNISWYHVKAHADNHMNNLVDKLARKEAMKFTK